MNRALCRRVVIVVALVLTVALLSQVFKYYGPLSKPCKFDDPNSLSRMNHGIGHLLRASSPGSGDEATICFTVKFCCAVHDSVAVHIPKRK